MTKLLPTRPDFSDREPPEPRLLTIDEDAADEVFEALASQTARTIFASLQREPMTASALAEACETSVQNCRYHLDQLQAADLVEVAGTQYSSKGREMSVYAPADEPLVMFAGDSEPQRGLRALLERFAGAIAGIAVLSLLAHSVLEGGLAYVDLTGGGGTGDGPTGPPFATGVFVGGTLVAMLALAAWYWSGALSRFVDRSWQSPVLTGTDLKRSRTAVMAATGGGVLVAAFWLLRGALDLLIPAIGPFGLPQWLLIGLVGGAAVQAYLNEGLFVSWAVVFIPSVALGLSSIGLGLAGEGLLHVPGAIGYPVILGGIGAVGLGSVGFLLGVGARFLVGGLDPGQTPAEE